MSLHLIHFKMSARCSDVTSQQAIDGTEHVRPGFMLFCCLVLKILLFIESREPAEACSLMLAVAHNKPAQERSPLAFGQQYNS